MSLIQEALEKVQDNRSGKTGPGQGDNAALSSPEARPILVKDLLSERPGSRPVKKKFDMSRFASKHAVFFSAVAFAVVVLSAAFIIAGNRTADKDAAAEPFTTRSSGYAPVIAKLRNAVSARSAAVPNLALNGIMYEDENPRAIVNGYTVREGGSVSGAVVKEIRKDCVVLSTPDAEVTLRLQ